MWGTSGSIPDVLFLSGELGDLRYELFPELVDLLQVRYRYLYLSDEHRAWSVKL